MSFLKHLLTNWLGGGRYSGGGKHGGGKHGYYDKHSPMSSYGTPGTESPMQSSFCPTCAATNTPQARFCHQCGANLVSGSCSTCKQPLNPGDKFCNKCGKQQ